MCDLSGRVVLVTGGTGSLGQGVVSALVAAGASVVTTSHRPPPPPVARVTVEVVDLADPDAVSPLLERTLAKHGRVDGLVCLVGGFRGGSFIQTDDTTWRELVDLNLHTTANVIRAALP